MLKNTRSVCLDVCDYDNNIVCKLYDSTADISGQATDVFVRKERNGWKELSFKLPSTCSTDEGVENNFRINYLIADYKIRVTENKPDDTTIIDWFIISENRVSHSIDGKTVEVIAGHISQLLKTKNLGLEFSDQEGNNVGTCEELLGTILEGTGWTIGNVAEFYEDNGRVIKVRSLSAEMRTGAFRLITELCDKFEARPVFNGDYTVDILPINPFSEVKEGEIPEPVLNDEVNVIELTYNRNMHGLTRSLNTDNMITRLYAYGSYGDMNGICGLSTCKHTEIVYKNTAQLSNGQEVKFVDEDGITHYFTVSKTVPNNTQFVWSLLDFISETYVWDGTTAYELYLDPKKSSQATLTKVETKLVQNYFDYLMDFEYYRKVDLFKDAHLQKVAKFQRDMPAVIKAGMDASSALIEKEEELSKISESNTGFLRLDVAYYDSGSNGELKLVLKKSVYPDGVIYRSDYDEAKRNYFNWYVADKLKDNGDPVNDLGSLVYIVHNTSPITYERAYLKEINGVAESYYYDDRFAEEPNDVTLWISRAKVPTLSNGDQFFLFCSNSISGLLGARESELEALSKTLQQSTKIVTEEHPTYFVWDNDPAPSTSDILKTYGWYYRSYSNASTLGQLYFCYGEQSETTWHPVSIGTTAPAVVNGNYFYNIKERKVYHGAGNQWVWEDDTDTKRLGNNFTKVITACKKRDMLYKGVYQKYNYTPSSVLSVGNYIFKNEYDYYYAFSTDMLIPSGHKIWMDTEENLIYQDSTVESVIKPELKAFDALIYPAPDEFANTSFGLGIINRSTGVEENSESFYRSNNITVYGNVIYQYKVPANSYIVFFDSKKRFLEQFSLNTSGTFTTKDRAKYCRVVVPQVASTSYFRVNGYDNCVFIGDRQYKILNFTGEGIKLGMHYLLAAMRDRANEAYLTYLPIYKEAMQTIKDNDAELTSYLGDMYREGYWQKNEYVEGDEDMLYKDAKDALVKIAKPEATYDFTFLDLYQANNGIGYSIDELEQVDWPDIDYDFAVHLVDQDIDTNVWAAVEVVNKCYDQRWLTQLEITTELSTIRQHSFTDALAYIADVANATKMNQTIYQRAANLTGAGKLAANKLEGAIQTAKTSILGGSSNWYTDPRTGGIVLVSSDNSSAMMLTGAGFLIANTKDEYGDFNWRSAGTGGGLTADVITAGEMSAERLLAGSITTDKVVASFGQELEIGSNKALMLYATADGYRPAGGLKTQVATGDGRFVPVAEGDSYIEIAAKQGANPAYVNIMTGGELNLQGSTMNLAAKSEMYLYAGTKLDIRSDSDIEINAKSKLNIMSGSDLTIHSPHFNVYQDASGIYRADIDGVIKAKAGIIAGFNIGAIYKDNVPHDPEIDSYVLHRYIYSGTDSINSNAAGIYMGTNGLNVGGKLKYIVDGTKSYLTAEAESVTIGKQSTTTKGTFMKMDAQAGTIDLEAASSVNIKGNSTVAITANKSVTITSSGSVIIGNGTNPFTVGAVGDRAYIYNKLSSMTPRDSQSKEIPFGTAVAGVYYGSDGINLANMFKVTSAGVLHLKGTIYADAGTIGGWLINAKALYSNDKTVGLVSDPDKDIKIFAGNLTDSSAPFYVKADGSLYSTKGTIAGWKITSTSLYSDDESVGLTTSGDYRIFAGNKTVASSSFYVKKDGTLHAAKGDVGGWYIGTNYIGNQNTLANSSVGLASGTGDSIVIWAGNKTVSSANFYVTANGYLMSKSGKIGGWYIGSNYLGNATTIANSTVGFSASETGTDVVLWAGNKTIANAPFYVQANGYMKATSGTIGGWSITDTQLYSNDEKVVLSTSGDYVFWASDTDSAKAVFSVKKDGTLKSTKGTIGGWSIGTSQLSGTKTGMAVTSKDTDVAFWAGVASGGSADSGNFYVKQSGALYAGSATIVGSVTATSGDIGGWSITDGWLTGGKAGMGSKTSGTYAFWAGNTDKTKANFWVKHDGNVYASNIELKGTVKAKNLYVGATDSADGTQIKADSSGFVVSTSTSDVGAAIKSTAGIKVTTNGVVISSSTTDAATALKAEAGIKVDSSGVVISSSTSSASSAVKTAAGIKVDSTTGIVISTDATEADGVNKVAAITLDNKGKITISSTDVGQSGSKIYVTTTGISLSGGTFSVSSDNFGIDSSGNVTMKGNITASGGLIGATYDTTSKTWSGGWRIESQQLSAGSGTGYVALNSNNTRNSSNQYVQPYCIWAGNGTATDAPFRVSRDGDLYINALKVNDGGTWKTIDLSGNFSNAVSLSSGGSWSGNKFTATVKLWGKINKTITMTASVQLTDASYLGFFLDTKKVMFKVTVKRLVNDSESGEQELEWSSGIDCTPLYNYGYSQAAGKVSGPNEGSGNSCSITIPKASAGVPASDDTITIVLSKDSTPSSSGYAYMKSGGTQVARLDIGSWYTAGSDAGYADGKKEYRPDSIETSVNSAGQLVVTPKNAAGDAITGAFGTGKYKHTVNIGGNTVRFARHSKDDTPTGTWYSIVSSGGDLTYFVVEESSKVVYY